VELGLGVEVDPPKGTSPHHIAQLLPVAAYS
jgi:hypothetical protein